MGRLPESYIASPAERELRELVRHRAKLVARRSGLKARVHAPLAKQEPLPPMSDLFGVAGTEWLRDVPLGVVYRQRVDSLAERIDAYDGEIEHFCAESRYGCATTAGTYRTAQGMRRYLPLLATCGMVLSAAFSEDVGVMAGAGVGGC